MFKLDHLNKKIQKRKEKIKLSEKTSVKVKKEESKVNTISAVLNGGGKAHSVDNRANNIAILTKLTNPQTEKSVDDEKFQIVNRLDEICKKYKNLMEPEDNTDFENIVDTLKANLID
jgi:hypothetical protein